MFIQRAALGAVLLGSPAYADSAPSVDPNSIQSVSDRPAAKIGSEAGLSRKLGEVSG